jgi:hypothetical protein
MLARLASNQVHDTLDQLLVWSHLCTIPSFDEQGNVTSQPLRPPQYGTRMTFDYRPTATIQMPYRWVLAWLDMLQIKRTVLTQRLAWSHSCTTLSFKDITKNGSQPSSDILRGNPSELGRLTQLTVYTGPQC